jgi:hypothetical protein
MRRQYLHVSAYSCDKCGGPVIQARPRYARMKYRRRLRSGKLERLNDLPCRAATGKAKRLDPAAHVTFHRFNGTHRTLATCDIW